MKRWLSLVIRLSAVIVMCLTVAHTAGAAWNQTYCDIVSNWASALMQGVDSYNASEEEDRLCELGIRFMTPHTIELYTPITITQSPPEGHEYGFAIRKCVDSEAGCEVEGDTDVVLDFSDYGGVDCPIRVYEGANVDFINFKMIVPNPEKAFCTDAGNPIPVEDQSNSYAWIHNVTVEASSSHPDPGIRHDPFAGKYRAHVWRPFVIINEKTSVKE